MVQIKDQFHLAYTNDIPLDTKLTELLNCLEYKNEDIEYYHVKLKQTKKEIKKGRGKGKQVDQTLLIH